MKRSSIVAWAEPRRSPLPSKPPSVPASVPASASPFPTKFSLNLRAPPAPAPAPAPASPPISSPRPRGPKPQWLKDREATIAALRLIYPKAFSLREPRPLAIGAGKEILAHDLAISRKKIREALRWWSSGEKYLSAVARAGSARVKLDGTEAEVVSEEHRTEARRRLDELKARRHA